MPEFLEHPASIPALIGFAAGFLLSTFIYAIRISSARSKARERENASDEQTAHLHSEKSALENELAHLRTLEAKFLKRQGELESLAKTDKKREEEMAQFLGFAKSTLQSELRKHENAIVSSLKAQEQAPQSPPSAPPASQNLTVPPPRSSPVPLDANQEGTPHDDRDFVPIQSHPGEVPREANFEGFVVDQSAEKAESAANTLRAALEDNPS